MGSSVRVQLDQAGIDRLLRSPSSFHAETYLPRIGNRIVNGAKRRANVDTGLMRSRIEFRLDTSTQPPTGVVAARTRYSRYVHDGTRFYAGNPFLVLAMREVIG